eukprot:3774723-Amphidinium_carterae.1
MQWVRQQSRANTSSKQVIEKMSVPDSEMDTNNVTNLSMTINTDSSSGCDSTWRTYNQKNLHNPQSIRRTHKTPSSSNSPITPLTALRTHSNSNRLNNQRNSPNPNHHWDDHHNSYVRQRHAMDKITAMTTLWQTPTIDREHSSRQDYALNNVTTLWHVRTSHASRVRTVSIGWMIRSIPPTTEMVPNTFTGCIR